MILVERPGHVRLGERRVADVDRGRVDPQGPRATLDLGFERPEGGLALDGECLGDDVGDLLGPDELVDPVAELLAEAAEDGPVGDVALEQGRQQVGEQPVIPGGHVRRGGRARHAVWGLSRQDGGRKDDKRRQDQGQRLWYASLDGRHFPCNPCYPSFGVPHAADQHGHLPTAGEVPPIARRSSGLIRSRAIRCARCRKYSCYERWTYSFHCMAVSASIDRPLAAFRKKIAAPL